MCRIHHTAKAKSLQLTLFFLKAVELASIDLLHKLFVPWSGICTFGSYEENLGLSLDGILELNVHHHFILG